MALKTKQWLWIFPVFWMGLIFYISHQPRIRIPGPGFPGIDKVIHFFVYFILSVLWQCSLQSNSHKTCCWVWIMGTLYGISDEIHQSFIPGRHYEIADMVADSFGAFCGAFLFQHPRLLSWKKQREKRWLNRVQVL